MIIINKLKTIPFPEIQYKDVFTKCSTQASNKFYCKFNKFAYFHIH